jgi:hypothetical protein
MARPNNQQTTPNLKLRYKIVRYYYLMMEQLCFLMKLRTLHRSYLWKMERYQLSSCSSSMSTATIHCLQDRICEFLHYCKNESFRDSSWNYCHQFLFYFPSIRLESYLNESICSYHEQKASNKNRASFQPLIIHWRYYLTFTINLCRLLNLSAIPIYHHLLQVFPDMCLHPSRPVS